MELGPGFLGWQNKQLLRLDNMPTEIDESKKDVPSSLDSEN